MRITENKQYVTEILAKQDTKMVDDMLNLMNLKDSTKRKNIHMLVENTKKWLLSEEFTRSDDVVGLTPAFIPMVTRMMPSLIAPEIVGTQVLNTPVGLVWGWRVYLAGKDSSYASGGLTVGFTNGAVLQLSAQSTLTQSTSTPSVSTDYDIRVGGVVVGTCRVLHQETNNTKIFVKLVSSKVELDSNGAYALTGAETETTPVSKLLADYLDAQVKSGSAVTIHAVGNAVAIHTVNLVLKNWDKDYIFNSIFKNYTGSHVTSALEGDSGLDQINRMAIKLEKSVAEAKSRKLRVDFSFEAMQDAMSLYNYDIQTELIKMAIRQIALEIDAEIIDKVKHLAEENTIESFNFQTVAGLDPIGKIQSLLLTISKVAVEIAQDTRLGKGNILITNSKGLSLLSILPIFEKSADYNGLGTSVQKAGTLGGVYKVFLDIYSKEDAIYVCFKGSGESEAGVIYAPYTPIQVKSVVGTETFMNHNLFYTRYALIDNLYGSQKFYRKIELKNLGF